MFSPPVSNVTFMFISSTEQGLICSANVDRRRAFLVHHSQIKHYIKLLLLYDIKLDEDQLDEPKMALSPVTILPECT